MTKSYLIKKYRIQIYKYCLSYKFIVIFCLYMYFQLYWVIIKTEKNFKKSVKFNDSETANAGVTNLFLAFLPKKYIFL